MLVHTAENATGSMYRDKGDYTGNFTIIMKAGQEEMMKARAEDLKDWLECP
ncbi:MAG: hypothetical protein IMF19_04970 [Proteobacteria bacterium]|nr:hypothetical protein [Pseudomonadota bacterium]